MMMTDDENRPMGKISRTAWMDAPETLAVMHALCGQADDCGDEARFVGGCVRDAVLNVKAVDVDIATLHTPDAVMERLKTAGIKTIPTGIDHGTVTAVTDGRHFEITTLRSDVETDGRHATVAFTGSWREDARRRDFTMNALYLNIRGELYDYFGGLEDARAGIVRFIDDPAARIREDYLRILRFYRFSARYGKTDSAAGHAARAACRKNLEGLSRVSAERQQTEILKLLRAGQAAAVWEMMIDDGVVEAVLPYAVKTDALARLTEMEEKLDIESYDIRRLAALVGYNASGAEMTADSLKLSNSDRMSLLLLCDSNAAIATDTPAPLLRQYIYRTSTDSVISRLLLAAASHDAPDEAALFKSYETVTKTRLPDFPAKGQDVIDCGLPPGPAVGMILKQAEDWWIEKDFAPKRSETLERIRQMAKELLP